MFGKTTPCESHCRGGSLVMGQFNKVYVDIKIKDETHPYVNQTSTTFRVIKRIFQIAY
jgi:hypothetical protein